MVGYNNEDIEINEDFVELEDVQQSNNDVQHDEIQIECPKDKAEEVGKLAVECIERTGKHFNLRVPLTGQYKSHTNWSGTH